MTVPAGHMPPWEVGPLEPPPKHSWRKWTALIGPGILLAGSSVGAGEWLFGPAVSAQFGGTFLWLATISIVTQAFYNLEVMRYTLYCGEPIFVGYFRLAPGPKFWTAIYLVLCVAHIWPFMAANAAVPLSAAILGHLPGDGTVHLAAWTIGESSLVKGLGYVIFLLAFLPLIFGGKIYNVLERMMTVKLVVVLGFLVGISLFLISARNVREVVTGFFRFGEVAIRADTVVASPHFDIRHEVGEQTYVIRGTLEHSEPVVTKFGAMKGRSIRWIADRGMSPADAAARESMRGYAKSLVKPHRFFLRTRQGGVAYAVSGQITGSGVWTADEVLRTGADGKTLRQSPESLAGDERRLVGELVANQGFERRGVIGYWRQHGALPPMEDWSLLAAFAAIAGAGMLSNALFSNYARDKGWGMGAQTGAIPSAIGGHRISLSDVGKVFTVTEETLQHWRGWFRHIVRDQSVWILCSVIGMALPCMMSLEFIRNAPVAGDRVTALTADGLASRFPAYASFWWTITLFVSFMVLAPNAVFAGDLIARLWTDLIWVAGGAKRDRSPRSVIRVYYGILLIYAVWGLITLAMFDPLQIAKVGAVLGNVALGFSAFHTWFVNRRFLPKELQPNWFMQAGLLSCGVFFLGITVVTVLASGG
jgi:hypothetical protein